MALKTVSKHIRPIWIFSIAIATFSLLLNLYFVVSNYSRSIVHEVVDGDTLQMADGRRVRLRSIDAPEESRCMAPEARKNLSDAALNRHIRLKDTMIDSYGRILAIVIVEDFPAWIGYLTSAHDPLLNRVMVKNGLARHFSSGTTYDMLLKQFADSAKEKKLGIYSDLCRKTTPKNNCDIKGNLRSGIKTYYLPLCKAYDQVIVDEAYGDSWFCSEKEALERDYIKAKTCL